MSTATVSARETRSQRKVVVTGVVFGKDAKGKATITVSSAFKASAVKAATDLVKTVEEKLQTAVNLYTAFQAARKAGVSYMGFFHAIDENIPAQSGKVGSPERKAIASNKVFKQLEYLTNTVGKNAVEKPKSDKQIAQEAADRIEARKDKETAIVGALGSICTEEKQVKRILLAFGFGSVKEANVLNATGLKIYKRVADTLATHKASKK